LITNLYIK